MQQADRAVIQTLQLSHRFRALDVLKDLSLEIPRGSICGLLGRNGSGKTTLLRILIGLLHPYEGSSRVFGLDPLQDPVKIRRRVGYMPQESDYDPEMTVQQTIDFIRPFYGDRWSDEELQRQLERFELEGIGERKIDFLSAGMLQRLMLAITLAPGPELLLLDEPTAGLDALVRRNFAEAVVDYMSVPGRTVVLSSHLLSELERLVDYVVFLKPWAETLAAPLDDFKEKLVRFEVVREEDTDTTDTIALPEGVRALANYRRGDSQVVSIWEDGSGSVQLVKRHLEASGNQVREVSEASLDSIFVDLMET